MQLEFLYKELSESYKGVFADLKSAKTILAASNSVLMKFERPANQSAAVQNIAQRVSNIETKVDDTNSKVDAQVKAWQETERKLSEKVNETENKPYKQIASNVNSIKVAVITCICTLLVSGIIGAIVMFGK